MELLVKGIDFYNTHIGPWALLLLLLPTGILLAITLKFIQVRRLGHAAAITAGRYDDPDDEGDISHFQALCAALSATVGIGNIAGVALAIHFGGPWSRFLDVGHGNLGNGAQIRRMHPGHEIPGRPRGRFGVWRAHVLY